MKATTNASVRYDGDDDGGSFLSLIRDLHRASEEAATGGYREMALLLDECRAELASSISGSRTRARDRSLERAAKCLEAWRALRGW